MSLTVNRFGLYAVVLSGITGTRSSSTNTGRCLATALTLGGGLSALHFFTSSVASVATLANTSDSSLRRSKNA